MRSAGCSTTTLPRPRADVVCAKAIAARTASTLISLLGLRLAAPCRRRRRLRRRAPSRAPRAAPRARSTSRSGCERAATRLAARATAAGPQRVRAGRSASHSQACASVERELELADAAAARAPAAHARAASRSACCSGAPATAAAALPSARPTIRAPPSAASIWRQTASRSSGCIDAHEALRRGLRARRVAGAHALEEGDVLLLEAVGARAPAARRSAASAGGRSNQSVRSGCSSPLHPLLELRAALQRRSRGRRPGRRTSHR